MTAPNTIRHVHEVLQLMSVLTQDHRFEDVANEQQKGAASSMCEILDKVEARGEARGILLALYDLVKDGILTVQDAAKRANISETAFIAGMNAQAK